MQPCEGLRNGFSGGNHWTRQCRGRAPEKRALFWFGATPRTPLRPGAMASRETNACRVACAASDSLLRAAQVLRGPDVRLQEALAPGSRCWTGSSRSIRTCSGRKARRTNVRGVIVSKWWLSRARQAVRYNGGERNTSAGVVGIVTKGTQRVSDEVFSCRLLTEYLSNDGKSGFSCNVNSDDPPDLVVTWDDGSQWGVEVTRTYQQVPSSDGASAISSAGITEPLLAFGERLGTETANIRMRDYTLGLGPDPADVLRGRSMAFDTAWKRQTEQAIRQHIHADRTDVLRCPGVWFKPSGPGNRWTVTANPGVTEINPALHVTLERALKEKSKGLPRWKGHFVQRWLLLLNAYPLVDDVGEVQRTVMQLIRSNPNYCGFDGVFWSGDSDRSLFPIPIGSSK